MLLYMCHDIVMFIIVIMLIYLLLSLCYDYQLCNLRKKHNSSIIFMNLFNRFIERFFMNDTISCFYAIQFIYILNRCA